MQTNVALHGFLGEPSDWKICSNLLAYDLFNDPIIPFWVWAERFNKQMKKMSHPRTLIGYSLGGRLAMHALIQNSSLWSAAVIISAHPGLKTTEQKEIRLEKDREWAKKFFRKPWGQLLEDWDKQSVFENKPSPFERLEANFSREKLVAALEFWSLGRQDDLQNRLEGLHIPILWVAGEQDLKYVNLSNSIKFSHDKSHVWIAEGAAHRVPWEVPEQWSQAVQSFLSH